MKQWLGDGTRLGQQDVANKLSVASGEGRCPAALFVTVSRCNNGALARVMIVRMGVHTVLVATELTEGRLSRPAKNQLPVKMRLLGKAQARERRYDIYSYELVINEKEKKRQSEQ